MDLLYTVGGFFSVRFKVAPVFVGLPTVDTATHGIQVGISANRLWPPF